MPERRCAGKDAHARHPRRTNKEASSRRRRPRRLVCCGRLAQPRTRDRPDDEATVTAHHHTSCRKPDQNIVFRRRRRRTQGDVSAKKVLRTTHVNLRLTTPRKARTETRIKEASPTRTPGPLTALQTPPAYPTLLRHRDALWSKTLRRKRKKEGRSGGGGNDCLNLKQNGLRTKSRPIFIGGRLFLWRPFLTEPGRRNPWNVENVPPHCSTASIANRRPNHVSSEMPTYSQAASMFPSTRRSRREAANVQSFRAITKPNSVAGKKSHQPGSNEAPQKSMKAIER